MKILYILSTAIIATVIASLFFQDNKNISEQKTERQIQIEPKLALQCGSLKGQGRATIFIGTKFYSAPILCGDNI